MDNSIVIYQDAPVIIKTKITHIRKIGGRTYRAFIKDYGDIPVAVINSITGQLMEVENNRGMAYACRNRLRYRNKKK